MPALDFPSSPTIGQTYSANGLTYTFNGVSWALASPGSPPPSFIGVRAYNVGTQTLTNATNANVTFNTEAYDTFAGGMHSIASNTHQFTIPVSGYWDGVFTTSFASNSVGNRYMWFQKNGVDLPGSYDKKNGNAAAGQSYQTLVMPAQYFVAGDIISVVAYQDSGGSLAIGSATADLGMSSLTLTKVDGVVGPAGASGTPSGTTFPASPGTGQQFFRTDLGLECYYDGTRWLTKNEYAVSLNGSQGAWTATTVSSLMTVNDQSQSGMWITRFLANTFILSGTSNGSNYFTVQLQSADAADVAHTNLGSSFTTASDAVNTHVKHTVVVGAAVNTAHTYISPALTKTGTPGSLYFFGSTVFYRLIVT